MPTRGSALFAASKRGQSVANAKDETSGRRRGVGSRCESIEICREPAGDGSRWRQGENKKRREGKDGMGDGHEREQEQEQEAGRSYRVTWRT